MCTGKVSRLGCCLANAAYAAWCRVQHHMLRLIKGIADFYGICCVQCLQAMPSLCAATLPQAMACPSTPPSRTGCCSCSLSWATLRARCGGWLMTVNLSAAMLRRGKAAASAVRGCGKGRRRLPATISGSRTAQHELYLPALLTCCLHPPIPQADVAFHLALGVEPVAPNSRDQLFRWVPAELRPGLVCF